MKIDVKTLPPMCEVLSSARAPVEIKLNGGDVRRFVYWPDDPDGGCGVSYLDPVTNRGNWIEGWMRSPYDERKEIVIAKDSDSELGRRLMSIDIFQDVAIERRECYCVVSKEFGYDSVAYAVAFFLSLSRHNLIDAAMRSFESFLRYHPIDSITRKCDIELSRKSRDIYCDQWGKYDGCSSSGFSEKEDCLDTDYYVDGSPVYDVSSQEEAEIEYWNTH